jgi:hypothetical protein
MIGNNNTCSSCYVNHFLLRTPLVQFSSAKTTPSLQFFPGHHSPFSSEHNSPFTSDVDWSLVPYINCFSFQDTTHPLWFRTLRAVISRSIRYFPILDVSYLPFSFCRTIRDEDCGISKEMWSFYFGLAVFCPFEACFLEFDTQPPPRQLSLYSVPVYCTLNTK